MNQNLRQARASDAAAMHRVRMSVHENRLVSIQLTERDYQVAIEQTGRGWVVEQDGAIVAFAIGDVTDGSIWALFVEPGHEAKGYGRELHDVMVAWLWQQGHEQLSLTTEPGTRAERFYEKAGWQRAGITDRGEVRFELSRGELR
ncbi:GNAT family N-acetyltransferase [Steroidobacter sp.]|uniref:GNAT family N-acetyltransferase n=1 Tax=Steroidobacter sp. TaxID=1978227 RepID=UPI001A47C6C5|nr:GNAT family N-acetyltransferase [Steroidobacter sp.]MBL8268219.1 GNAT family N-acetyltransferase [Steroidobacter sp.]